ncbi:TlpA family protein disulfide reductase [Sphingobacterium sp. MYb382]|uniref:TlpA family protein disulfide reductase n=1 Tax=Sphingobacterium sp. MYb382 TaxID=2745278 RepID=UPI0030B68B7A
MKTTFKGISIGLCCLGLTISACTQAHSEKNNSPAGDKKQELAILEDQPQEEVFMVKDEQGNTIKLSDLKGKVVFINFWATWCPPCIAEMPSIASLKKTFKDDKDLVFLMVDVDNNIKKSTKFMAKEKLDLPVHVPASQIPATLLGSSIPTTVIIDKKGEIVVRAEGGRDYTNPKIIAAVKDLLAE